MIPAHGTSFYKSYNQLLFQHTPLCSEIAKDATVWLPLQGVPGKGGGRRHDPTWKPDTPWRQAPLGAKQQQQIAKWNDFPVDTHVLHCEIRIRYWLRLKPNIINNKHIDITGQRKNTLIDGHIKHTWDWKPLRRRGAFFDSPFPSLA